MQVAGEMSQVIASFDTMMEINSVSRRNVASLGRWPRASKTIEPCSEVRGLGANRVQREVMLQCEHTN